MSAFTTPLIIKDLGNGRTWELDEPFTYDIGELGGETIIIPAGFVTDFASVPRLLWSLIPPWGKYGKAAVLHDWLYFTGTYTRAKSDSIFLEAMKVLHVPWLKRSTIYAGVRTGGWWAWRAHRKKRTAAQVISSSPQTEG